MRAAHFLIAAALTAGPVLAQEYRWEQNDKLRIRYAIHKKLQPVPLQLGITNKHYVAKYEPGDVGDYIHGRYGMYSWEFYLLEFPKNQGNKEKEKEPAGGTTTSSNVEEAIANQNSAANFREWVTEKDPGIKDRKFAVKGDDKRGRRKTPDFKWWEYADSQKMSNGYESFDQIWYKAAAVYDFPDREIALVINVPVNKGTRPATKHMRWILRMTQTLQVLEEDDVEGITADERRDEFANTPERKKQLEKAKENILNVEGWDYFTSPNYIILYSWDPEKSAKQRDGYKFASHLVSKLEEARELYLRDFPPPEDAKFPYSVLRICNDYDEFRKYGNSRGGVIGWFHPVSKELVIFDDKDKYLAGMVSVEAVAIHEGWHQYSNAYFDGAELHRWFDEGLGDYFGSHERKGRRWVYEPERGRYQSIRGQIARENYIALREIVTWNKDKFYGPRASDHYAQGYSFIDFLRRGPEKLGRRFNPAWTGILDVYRETMLKTKNQKKAVEKAFEGVDWDEIEEAWIDWVRKHMK